MRKANKRCASLSLSPTRGAGFRARDARDACGEVAKQQLLSKPPQGTQRWEPEPQARRRFSPSRRHRAQAPSRHAAQRKSESRFCLRCTVRARRCNSLRPATHTFSMSSHANLYVCSLSSLASERAAMIATLGAPILSVGSEAARSAKNGRVLRPISKVRAALGALLAGDAKDAIAACWSVPLACCRARPAFEAVFALRAKATGIAQ